MKKIKRKRRNFCDITITDKIDGEFYWYTTKTNTWSTNPDNTIDHSSHQHFRHIQPARRKAEYLASAGLTVILHQYYWKYGKRQCSTYEYSPK
jgi:type IV secretory pathway VirD2 relaxase